ncbi:MAG TPA: transcription antitermination factor NusB [Thermoleophilaceae bacterium]|jgi:N utilization substance protein B|nr:transcription antitermination factor NusB [Thermoleophilaceae bacterium]
MRRADQRRAAVVALYQQDTGRPLEDVMPKDASSFTHELVDGVLEHKEELDALIERYAQGWTLDRIAPLERSILRVALYEMLHRTDVPDEVAIDEAVEAAKELCAAEAPGFVNGILGAVKRTEDAA